MMRLHPFRCDAMSDMPLEVSFFFSKYYAYLKPETGDMLRMYFCPWCGQRMTDTPPADVRQIRHPIPAMFSEPSDAL